MAKSLKFTQKRKSTKSTGMKKMYKKSMKKGYKPTGSNKGNYATLIETYESDLSANIGGSVRTTLGDFQRGMEVAHAYKYYRCAKVDVTFIPFANINSIGGGGGAGTRIPQLYRVVDRVNNMEIAETEAEMLERGSRPIMFTRKTSIAFKPSLLQQIQFDVNQPADGGGRPLGITSISALNSTPIFNKWLPTQQSYGYPQAGAPPQTGDTLTQNAVNPYALRYYGLSFFLAQDGAVVGTSLGQIQVRVTWEFKGARALATNVPVPQLPAHPETSSQENGVVPNTQPTSYP